MEFHECRFHDRMSIILRLFYLFLGHLLDLVLNISIDWFVIDWFRYMISAPYNFADPAQFRALKETGESCIANDKIDDLRQVIYTLSSIEIRESSFADMAAKTNIVRG